MLYAILFVAEIVLMLALGMLRPKAQEWTYRPRELVNLTPWRFAVPCAGTLLSCVVGLYLLFSPLGLVGGVSEWFLPLLVLLLLINLVSWTRFAGKHPTSIDHVREAS